MQRLQNYNIVIYCNRNRERIINLFRLLCPRRLYSLKHLLTIFQRITIRQGFFIGIFLVSTDKINRI